MSRQRLVSRLVMLEGQRLERQKRTVVASLSEQYDIDAADLMAEAEQLAAEFHRMGLVTFEEQLEYVATDLGITSEELREEIDDLMAACP